MFIHANVDVAESLLFYLNEMLRTGEIPPNWFNTHFALLHKGQDVHGAQNWRPLANLNIPYRILAKLVFNGISRSGLPSIRRPIRFQAVAFLLALICYL